MTTETIDTLALIGVSVCTSLVVLALLYWWAFRSAGGVDASDKPKPVAGPLRKRKVLTSNASMRRKYTWLPTPYSTPTPKEEAAKGKLTVDGIIEPVRLAWGLDTYEPIGTKPIVGDMVRKISGDEHDYRIGGIFPIKGIMQGWALPGFDLGRGPGIAECCFTEEDSIGHAYRILKRGDA